MAGDVSKPRCLAEWIHGSAGKADPQPSLSILQVDLQEYFKKYIINLKCDRIRNKVEQVELAFYMCFITLAFFRTCGLTVDNFFSHTRLFIQISLHFCNWFLTLWIYSNHLGEAFLQICAESLCGWSDGTGMMLLAQFNSGTTQAFLPLMFHSRTQNLLSVLLSQSLSPNI